ncbi:hypothetical protein QBC34DRAFT_470044 [Podospora aff. communis PSN243]|uniref:AA1-like domain-containing protein n=1 Tax=Podospora aff. communis PSN243 TaxID=3040156 RepID=A0AAV9GDN3_9PEZI|nr:hypothetical protein QBC34DRAFT_470044 [Podospora aff. communis PSN243]
MVLRKFILGLLLASQAIASPAPRIVQELSVTDIQARSTSCSATTFTNITGFILTEYLVDTVQVAGSNQTQTIATYGVLNPGTGDTYRLHRIPISAGGGTWSVCRAGETPIPSTLERCQILVERSERSRRLGFRFQWLCDADPKRPVLFDATVIASLPFEVCIDREGENGVLLSCEMSQTEVDLPFANISFEEVPAGN